MSIRYDAATGPSGGAAPGLIALGGHWHKVTGLGDLGIYNPRKIRGSQSRWSVHAEGRAIDLAADAGKLGERTKAERYLRFLIANAEALQVQLIIWNRHDWSQAAGWTDYGGTDPHTGHAHVELNRTGAEAVTLDQLDRLWALFTNQEDSAMLAFHLARIEYRYRTAGRDPHRDPKGVKYWADELERAIAEGRDPNGVEEFCQYLLDGGS